jgi:phage baseplate assembly protein W
MGNNAKEGKEFLGAGVAFPLGVNAEGRIALNSLEDQVRQSILLILQTAQGERVMRPDFGAGLHPLIFSPATASTAALAEHEVKQALIKYEPRIEVLEVKATFDPKEEGVLFINIQYRVRRTDTTFNLVYPFYLERGAL